ncbi:MAG: hypothetical protein IKJ95_04205, partial [Bacteroidaceae bacterium]|nr:hypothetical protein [Bacteroidaceae bacterium]
PAVKQSSHYFQKSNRFKLWNLTVPVKEITCAYHCAIVHHDRAKRRGVCFFYYNRKYFANPHLFATEP